MVGRMGFPGKDGQDGQDGDRGDSGEEGKRPVPALLSHSGLTESVMEGALELLKLASTHHYLLITNWKRTDEDHPSAEFLNRDRVS